LIRKKYPDPEDQVLGGDFFCWWRFLLFLFSKTFKKSHETKKHPTNRTQQGITF